MLFSGVLIAECLITVLASESQVLLVYVADVHVKVALVAEALGAVRTRYVGGGDFSCLTEITSS